MIAENYAMVNWLVCSINCSVHCSTSTCFGLGGIRWTINYFHNNTSSLFYWKIEHHSDIPPSTVPCAKNTGHIIYIVKKKKSYIDFFISHTFL